MDSEAFWEGLSTSCVRSGEPRPRLNMKFILGDGYISVVENRLIRCRLLNLSPNVSH